MPRWLPWVPGALLSLGCLLTLGVDRQRHMPLRLPLDSIAPVLAGFPLESGAISPAEQAVAGMTSYISRYRPDSTAGFWIYVGYYDHQTQGRTIHSPRNCLPGAGWETLTQRAVTLETAAGPQVVNRVTLQKGTSRALVYYWYQGRGRVAANEYRVKWELLRDAALQGRSEEALARIVIPLTTATDEAAAEALGTRVAAELIPEVFRVLPE